MIIKVDFEGDMRRISMTLPEDASSAEIFQAIRTAVVQGFEADEATFPALKYRDDEGDLCTLVEASVEDMLESAQGGSLRLFASKPKASSPQDADREAPAEELVTEEAAAQEAAAREAAAQDAASEEAISEEDTVAEEAVAEEPATGEEAVSEDVSVAEPVTEEDAAQNAEPLAEEAEGTSPARADQIAAIMAMGFSGEESQRALENSDGNLELAIEDLLSGKSQPAYEEATPAATVGELLTTETSTSSPDSKAATRKPRLKNCTRMDRVQVFVSKSTSMLRTNVCELFIREGHKRPSVTVQSQLTSSSAMAADEAFWTAAQGAQDGSVTTVAEEMAGAELGNANAVQADASDEFTHVSIAPTEANATVVTAH
jgi:hypothetical protein